MHYLPVVNLVQHSKNIAKLSLCLLLTRPTKSALSRLNAKLLAYPEVAEKAMLIFSGITTALAYR